MRARRTFALDGRSRGQLAEVSFQSGNYSAAAAFTATTFTCGRDTLYPARPIALGCGGGLVEIDVGRMARFKLATLKVDVDFQFVVGL